MVLRGGVIVVGAITGGDQRSAHLRLVARRALAEAVAGRANSPDSRLFFARTNKVTYDAETDLVRHDRGDIRSQRRGGHGNRLHLRCDGYRRSASGWFF